MFKSLQFLSSDRLGNLWLQRCFTESGHWNDEGPDAAVGDLVQGNASIQISVSNLGVMKETEPYVRVVHVLLETRRNTRKPCTVRLPITTWGCSLDDRRIHGLETSRRCLGYVHVDDVHRAGRAIERDVPEHAIRVARDDAQ